MEELVMTHLFELKFENSLKYFFIKILEIFNGVHIQKRRLSAFVRKGEGQGEC
jgi:hypothetical protein